MTQAVHQLLAALSYGDAISNEALAIQSHLRRAGYDSSIFAERADPRMARLIRPLWDYETVSNAKNVCLFHFSIGGAAGPLIHALPDRLVAIYHNITPARYFVGYHKDLVELCHQGRRELVGFRDRTELALGDSEFNRRELEEAGFRKTGVLPIVLEKAAYEIPPAPVTKRLFDDSRTNILFVGRIIPNKKIEDLITAFAVYQRFLDPRSRLLLVGDYRGHERYLAACRSLVRDFGLDEVVFLGHVEQEDLVACYRAADAFLCLSEHEGYCVPLLEAVLFGIPVVALDAGAVKETLAGGGILLESGSPEVVAGILLRLKDDSAFRDSVVRSQEATRRRIESQDFSRLLFDSLAPVLEAAPS